MISEGGRLQLHQLQPVLVQRIARDIADEFRRGAGRGIGNPDMAAGSRRPQRDSPGIDHLIIDYLGMEIGLVGDQVCLHVAAIAEPGPGKEHDGGHHGAG